MKVLEALEIENGLWDYTSALSEEELLRLTRLGDYLEKAASVGNAANLTIKETDAKFLERLSKKATRAEE